MTMAGPRLFVFVLRSIGASEYTRALLLPQRLSCRDSAGSLLRTQTFERRAMRLRYRPRSGSGSLDYVCRATGRQVDCL